MTIKSQLESIWQKRKEIIDLLFHQKVPLLVVLISYITFAKIDQTLEIYKAFILDSEYNKTFVSIFFISLLSVLIWFSSCLFYSNYGINIQKYKYIFHKKITWLTCILGIMPLLGLLLGFREAESNLCSSSDKPDCPWWSFNFFNNFSSIIFITILVFLVLLFIVMFAKTKEWEIEWTRQLGSRSLRRRAIIQQSRRRRRRRIRVEYSEESGYQPQELFSPIIENIRKNMFINPKNYSPQ